VGRARWVIVSSIALVVIVAMGMLYDNSVSPVPIKHSPLSPVSVRVWPTTYAVSILTQTGGNCKQDPSKFCRTIDYIDSPQWISVDCQRRGEIMKVPDDKGTNITYDSPWWSETKAHNGTLGWVSVYIQGLPKLDNIPDSSSNQA